MFKDISSNSDCSKSATENSHTYSYNLDSAIAYLEASAQFKAQLTHTSITRVNSDSNNSLKRFKSHSLSSSCIPKLGQKNGKNFSLNLDWFSVMLIGTIKDLEDVQML